MILAAWRTCPAPLPDQRRQMIHLCELTCADEDDLLSVNTYVDPFNAVAYSERSNRWSSAAYHRERCDGGST